MRRWRNVVLPFCLTFEVFARQVGIVLQLVEAKDLR